MQKIAVITGATSGIGFETARELVKRGFEVIHLARNDEKAKKTNLLLTNEVDEAVVSYVLCDLADLNTVKATATDLRKRLAHIDVLINNAGSMFSSIERSKDGIELHFALNHLGHFYLTTLLLPLLISSKSRVINVSSEAHRFGKIDFQDLERFKGFRKKGFRGYGASKICNILFTRELHRRYHEQGISAFSLHPGAVRTAFGHNMPGGLKTLVKFTQLFMMSPKSGAETSVFLATEPGIEKLSGSYFKKRKPLKPSSAASSYQNAVQLWDLSEEMILDVT